MSVERGYLVDEDPRGDLLSTPKPLQPLPMQIPQQLSQLVLQGQQGQLGSGAEQWGPGLPPSAPPTPLALFCMGASERPGVSEGQEQTPKKLQARF